MLEYAIIFFLLIVVGSLLFLLIKSGYFEPQKKKEEEKRWEDRIRSLETDFKQEKQKLDSEITEHKLKLAEEKNQVSMDYIREMKIFKHGQTLAIEKEIEDLKSSKILAAQKQAEREVEDILLRKVNRVNKLQEELTEHETDFQKRIEDMKSLESAAIAARIREYEEANKESFYKIQVSEEDIIEIEELEEILPRLRNPLPLRVAIYNIYYKDAVRDMSTRICGQNRVTGIYKITHIETGQCYIGQSVDIANRWQQHCKRGAGADQPTGSKLYPEMMKHGIHSFRFEIIEVVPDDKLNAREKFWGEYFGSKVFGYSIKN